MKIEFIHAKHKNKLELTKEVLDLCKNKTVAVYTTIQFIDNLETFKIQIESVGGKFITSLPSHTSKKGQILGCDITYSDLNINSNFDLFLYIGDGQFHPKALAYSNITEVYCFNPFNNMLHKVSKYDIDAVLRRERVGIIKFLSSKNIGVLVTTKNGQTNLRVVNKLKSKFPDKNFYIFIDNTFNFLDLENFNFVDVWVNTACPRIGYEDSIRLNKPLVNYNVLLELND